MAKFGIGGLNIHLIELQKEDNQVTAFTGAEKPKRNQLIESASQGNSYPL